MNFLHRGRPAFNRVGTPPEPAPQPVALATGLPVAAPASAGGTDALRALTRLDLSGVLRFDERHRIETERCNCCDGTPADRRWVYAELESLGDLADLTGRHGPWEAARRMWASVPRLPTTTNAKYWATLRGQR